MKTILLAFAIAAVLVLMLVGCASTKQPKIQQITPIEQGESMQPKFEQRGNVWYLNLYNK